jgi:hypothetical protein
MAPHTVTLPCLPRRSLSSVLSTTVGGRTFKAPRKAEWPPRVECLTTTTWHSGGLLPSFTQGVAVAAIDVRSHTNWVRRALQLGELMTAFEIPAATQVTFAQEVITQVDKLLPLPQPPVRARTDAPTNPSAQRATQLRRVLARVYAVSIQNQITTTVP